MEYEKIIEFPVFGYWMHIIYTDDIQTSREKHADQIGAMDEILMSSIDGMHSNNKIKPDGWIFFTPESSTGTIAHEVFHSLWAMFKFYGAKLENEIVAYHLGYMLDKIMDFKLKVDCAKALPIKEEDEKL